MLTVKRFYHAAEVLASQWTEKQPNPLVDDLVTC